MRFRIATFNVNSVRVRLAQVIAWLGENEPDVLCLQETKVQDKDFPSEPFLEAGYHVAFCGQKSYAGVAIVSREPLRDVGFGLEDDGPADEARLARGRFGEIEVLNTYVPQGREVDNPMFQYKLEWFGRVRRLMEARYDPDKPLVWVGDLNVAPEDIDVYDPKGLAKHVDVHPDAKAALEGVRTFGFVDCFRLHHAGEAEQYTYWDYRARNPIERGIGWRIDHIWATEALAQHCVGCWIDVEARKAERPSDHTLLVADFELPE